MGRIAATAVAVGGLAAVAVAPGTAAAATRRTTANKISSAENAKLGTILVAGNTVYTLKASKTPCTAECLKEWPPVLLPHGVTTPTAGTGVDASKLGTAAAAHHARQITWSGKRLYWYVDDKASGQVHGNVKNKWGKWSTVAVTAGATSNTTATTTAPAAPPAAAAETAPPDTAAPDTAPPDTAAPDTTPPAPQQTSPPATQPPATFPDTGGGGGTGGGDTGGGGGNGGGGSGGGGSGGVGF